MKELFNTSDYKNGHDMMTRYGAYLNKILMGNADSRVRHAYKEFEKVQQEDEIGAGNLSFYERMKIDELLRKGKEDGGDSFDNEDANTATQAPSGRSRQGTAEYNLRPQIASRAKSRRSLSRQKSSRARRRSSVTGSSMR